MSRTDHSRTASLWSVDFLRGAPENPPPTSAGPGAGLSSHINEVNVQSTNDNNNNIINDDSHFVSFPEEGFTDIDGTGPGLLNYFSHKVLSAANSVMQRATSSGTTSETIRPDDHESANHSSYSFGDYNDRINPNTSTDTTNTLGPVAIPITTQTLLRTPQNANRSTRFNLGADYSPNDATRLSVDNSSRLGSPRMSSPKMGSGSPIMGSPLRYMQEPISMGSIYTNKHKALPTGGLTRPESPDITGGGSGGSSGSRQLSRTASVNTIYTMNPLSHLPGYSLVNDDNSDTESIISTLPGDSSSSSRVAADSLSSSLNSKIGPLRSGGLGKEFWMKDENANECFNCGKQFTTWRRKHHCRVCGQIFCSNCAKLVRGEKYNYNGRMRICSSCLHSLDRIDHSDSSMHLPSPVPKSPLLLPTEQHGLIDTTTNHSSSIAITGTGRDIDDNEDDEIVRASTPVSLATTAGNIEISYNMEPVPAPAMVIAARRKGEHVEIAPSYNEFSSSPRQLGSRRNTNALGSNSRYRARANTIDGLVRTTPKSSRFSLTHDMLQNESSVYSDDDDNDADHDHDNSRGDSEDNTSSEDEQAMSVFSALHGYSPAIGYLDSPLSNKNLSHFDSNDKVSDLGGTSTTDLTRRPRSRTVGVRPNSVSMNKRRRSMPPNPRSRHSLIRVKKSTSSARLDDSFLSRRSFKMLTGTQNHSGVATGSTPVSSIDLNKASVQHLHLFLSQLLKDYHLDPEWDKILTPSLLLCSDSIDLDIKGGDSIDIRHYVKLKRIPGGKRNDSTYIDGIVFTKTLALKNMPREIDNPKILLVTFPIEYNKAGQHFMSLEPVLAQETEYLKNLVRRIVFLKPDVLICGKGVSGTALKLLADAGIAVLTNVKDQVIARVARYTKADIISYIDKLTSSPQLGECRKFEVKYFRHQNTVKSCVWISGIPKELGCTIVLRGADMESLHKVKEVAEFMIYVVFNLKLETSLMRDQFVSIPLEDVKTQLTVSTDEEKAVYFNDVITLQNNQVFSSSPFVHYHTPYLLRLAREFEAQYQKMKMDHDQLRIDSEKSDESLTTVLQMLGLGGIDFGGLPNSKEVTKEMIDIVMKEQLEQLRQKYEAQKRLWEQAYAQNPLMFSPMTHQNILFLYSEVNTETRNPCSGPDLLGMEFYGDSDLTLGQFVEQLCMNAHEPCQDCAKPSHEHYRNYVNGDGRLSVVVQEFQCRLPGLENTILMWSYCKICKETMPVVPMASATWKYSFGKYLELSFWSSPLSLRAGMCPHDIYRDHLRYFGLNNMAVRVSFETVGLLEILPPQSKVFWRPASLIKFKIDTYYDIRVRVTKFWDSVYDRLTKVILDSVSTEKYEDCKAKVEELKERVVTEKEAALQNLSEIFLETKYTDALNMNFVLRDLQLLVLEWDKEFLEFESTYLPSDRDIARYTAQQLKKMFLTDEEREKAKDKDKDKEKVSKTVPEKKDPPQGANKKSKDEETTTASDTTTIPVKSKLTIEPRDESTNSKPGSASSTTPSSPVKERVQKLNASINSSTSKLDEASANFIVQTNKSSKPVDTIFDQLSFPSNTLKQKFGNSKEFEKRFGIDGDTSSVGNSNKVASLARHFDQLSYELERERARERRRLDNSRYRAQPVTSVRPTVEVFKNLEDAVVSESDDESATSVLAEEGADQLSTSQENNGISEELDQSGDVQSQTATKSSSGRNTDGTITPHDRDHTTIQSLMQSLSGFWNDRSSSGWVPLDYPLNESDHLLADSSVIGREDEPSSLIALCLSAPDYIERISGRLGTTISNEDMKFELERWMLKKTGTHLKYQFDQGNSRMSCKVFYAEQFEAFRKQCGCNEAYISSLSRCIKWDSSGGKSGSAFLKTWDDRLVVKQLSQSELDAFVAFAPAYFEYMVQAFFHDLPTVLAKIFGFYQIQVKNPVTGKLVRMDLIVMENLFYNRKMSRIFDLKGSMRNRHVQQTGKENEVLLDENMVEYIYESPLFVREHSKRLLRSSLFNDTLFLAKMNVMDYSLVIGIDEDKRELVVGIIDFIRTFTWDKKLESWVKERGLVRGAIKEPTVVSPRQYKNRFREAMERYILMVPDCWSIGV